MRIDEGREVLPSKMGALCSILLLVILITFASYKIYILQARKSIDIIQAVKENHFDHTYVFGPEQGLNIAAAVFDPTDESTFEMIDPSYGRMRFSLESWSRSDDEKAFIDYTEIKSKQCTTEEAVTSESSGSKFWKISESFEAPMQTFYHLFQCIENSELEVYGQYGVP